MTKKTIIKFYKSIYFESGKYFFVIPNTFDDAIKCSELLKEGQSVVLSKKYSSFSDEDFNHSVNFLCGSAFILNATQKVIDEGLFAFIPEGKEVNMDKIKTFATEAIEEIKNKYDSYEEVIIETIPSFPVNIKEVQEEPLTNNISPEELAGDFFAIITQTPEGTVNISYLSWEGMEERKEKKLSFSGCNIYGLDEAFEEVGLAIIIADEYLSPEIAFLILRVLEDSGIKSLSLVKKETPFEKNYLEMSKYTSILKIEESSNFALKAGAIIQDLGRLLFAEGMLNLEMKDLIRFLSKPGEIYFSAGEAYGVSGNERVELAVTKLVNTLPASFNPKKIGGIIFYSKVYCGYNLADVFGSLEENPPEDKTSYLSDRGFHETLSSEVFFAPNILYQRLDLDCENFAGAIIDKEADDDRLQLFLLYRVGNDG